MVNIHNLLPQNVYAFLVRIHFIVIISMAIFNKILTTAAAKLLQLCPTLCDPIDGSLPGSLSLGFSRQEHWSGLPFLLQCMKVKSESEITQSCPTLRNPMDCILPGSSAHGIFQARELEWGAIAFSKVSLHIASKTTIQL